MKGSILLLISLVLFVSCSEDDGDVTSPTIISSSLSPNQTDVGVDSNIEVLFSEQIEAESAQISLTTVSTSEEHQFEVEYDEDEYLLTIIPSSRLMFNSSYLLSITGVNDLSGNVIDDFNLEFSTAKETGPARYTLVFNATWSESTHPTDIPTTPHFSGIIGATHSSDRIMFETGSLASTGIKNMAELGAKGVLIEEIEVLIAVGVAQTLISGDPIPLSPGQVSVEFDVTTTHSFVTLCSMIAPSPDWFVAVSQIDLYEKGYWIEELSIDVNSYDAGTDSGATFTSPNTATTPAENVSAITSPPLAVDGMVAALGSITFTRVE